jgi:photosystem II stability/assembly factor-like uncharacterized protein
MRALALALILLASLWMIADPNSITKVQAPSLSSNLHGLVMLSSSNGWAAGDGGTVLHFDGSSWSLIPSSTSVDLLGVSFGPLSSLNPNAGFAVGGTGGSPIAVYRSDVTWANASVGLTSPQAQRLASVFANSPTDAWAVDSVTGAFWHWSGSFGLGGRWTLVSSAIAGLNSVWMVSVSEGWAVGAGGVVYHYAAGGWTLYTTLGTTLNSVFMLNENEGWAVGNHGTIYHYTSGSWSGPVSPAATSQDLRSIFMLTQTEGWAVGVSGTVLHFSGGVWTALPLNLLSTNQNLNSVSFSGQTGWAVGDLGAIITISPQSTQGVPAAGLQSVYLSSKTDGWIVGCSTGGCGSGFGEPVVLHWDGTSFTKGTVSGPIGDLYSVYMASPLEGWAVGGAGGNPLILHYTGGSWVQVPAPPMAGVVLRSVFMLDSGNGWAVGSMGTILRYSGGIWGAVSSPTANTLRSVYMLGSTDGWAVGDGGQLLRYSNGQWLTIPSPTGAQLNSVFVFDSSHGWVVGAGGTVLHYDGSLWVSVAQSVSADLNSVFQVSPQEAWAVGDSATILQWNGFSWNTVTPSYPLTGNPDLNSVFIVSPSYGLVVGAPTAPGGQGTILQLPQTSPIPETGIAQLLLTVVLALSLAISRYRRKPSPGKREPSPLPQLA